MFHVKHDLAALSRVLDWVGRPYDPGVGERCYRYAELLGAEGIPAGAVGPDEGSRIWERHILDSLCFASAGAGVDWLDVGSGAGLPGIPLACAFPDIDMTLLDRAGRRTDLMRRWIRVLDLPNVTVVRGDVANHADPYDTICFRGSLTLERACAVTRRLAQRFGVFGFTHGGRRSRTPVPEGVEVIEVPDWVLDSGVVLLRITP